VNFEAFYYSSGSQFILFGLFKSIDNHTVIDFD